MIIDTYNVVLVWWNGILSLIPFPLVIVVFFAISFVLMYVFMVINIKNGESVWGDQFETVGVPFGLSIIILFILSFWPLVLAVVAALCPLAIVVYLLQKLAKLTAK